MTDYALGDTIYHNFTTRAFATGIPTTLAGTPVVSVYEDNSTTQITAGITLTVDFDTVTGLNNLAIVATSGNGFEAGKFYSAVITTGTVDSVSVVGETVWSFSVDASSALKPTTAGRTLDVAATGEAGVDLGNVTGTLTQANVGWVDANSRVDVGSWLGTPVTTSSTTSKPEIDVFSLADDSTAGTNAKNQYDGVTGLTGDTFPATQQQVGTLATGAGGISQVAESVTITTGTETSAISPIPGYTATHELDLTYHQIDDVGGNTDFYYQFDIGVTGQATEILWDGFAQSNGDSVDVFGWDWVASAWGQVGTIAGSNSTTRIEKTFIFTNSMTGTGANDGIVRLRFNSTTATSVRTDRVLCEYTSVAQESLILNSGVVQAATSNTVTINNGASAVDDFYNHASIVIVSGTGANQERIIVDYVGSTRVAKVAPPWVTQPDTTSSYEVLPGNCHAETGWATIKIGLAQTATATTITLESDASAVDDFYNDKIIYIDAGTGEGEDNVITDYNGTTKVATVENTWLVTPDATSEYVIEEANPRFDAAITTRASAAALATAQSDLDIITDTDGVVLGAAGVDLVWDEVLTGATHNIVNSAGRRLRGISGSILTDGTAQGGTANTIQLASGDVTIDDQYVRSKVVITGGTGAGQEAIITDSVASTDTLTITPAWLVTVDATSDYNIIPAQSHATVRNGGYDNAKVYVDVVNGSAGTAKGVNGTSTNPSSVLADARTIADQEGIRIFDLKGGGLITLDQAYTNWIFDHTNAALIDLNSQDVSGSVFLRTGVTGTGTHTTRGVFELCGVVNLTVGVCNFLQTGFQGTTTLSAEDRYLAWDCFENDTTTPIINVAGDGITATTLEMVNYSGRVEIQNMTSVDVVVISGQAKVTLNANCSGGSLTIAGDVHVTDNSGNVTIANGHIADIESRIPAALVSGKMDSDARAINGSTDAATQLARSAETIVFATATATTLSTTQMSTDLTESTNDHYNGRIILWKTGVLEDQASDITDYDGTTKTLTYTATTEAPSAGDTFVIV